MKYGIYVPRITSSYQILYKDLVVLIIEDEKIIGAREYDYNGKSKVVSYLGYAYNKNYTKYIGNIINIKDDELNDTKRTMWLFDTEEAAYIQKIWILKKIRSYFKRLIEKEINNFNNSLPEYIDEAFYKTKQVYPEYWL